MLSAAGSGFEKARMKAIVHNKLRGKITTKFSTYYIFLRQKTCLSFIMSSWIKTKKMCNLNRWPMVYRQYSIIESSSPQFELRNLFFQFQYEHKKDAAKHLLRFCKESYRGTLAQGRSNGFVVPITDLLLLPELQSAAVLKWAQKNKCLALFLVLDVTYYWCLSAVNQQCAVRLKNNEQSAYPMLIHGHVLQWALCVDFFPAWDSTSSSCNTRWCQRFSLAVPIVN